MTATSAICRESPPTPRHQADRGSSRSCCCPLGVLMFWWWIVSVQRLAVCVREEHVFERRLLHRPLFHLDARGPHLLGDRERIGVLAQGHVDTVAEDHGVGEAG